MGSTRGHSMHVQPCQGLISFAEPDLPHFRIHADGAPPEVFALARVDSPALIPSMSQRLEAVLNAKGGMTKY